MQTRAEWLKERNALSAAQTARRAVRTALDEKVLVRPKKCSRCGAKPPVDAQGNSQIQALHLNGYGEEDRLNIVWVCVSCRCKVAWDRRRANNV